MQKTIFKFLFLATIIILNTSACKKIFNKPTDSTIVEDIYSKKVTASLSGLITDEDGVPLQNALVTIKGLNSKWTDANGYFSFHNVQLSERKATIKVEKANYFTGFRSMMVQANQTHIARVQLMKKEAPQNFMSNIGGEVTFTGGLSISFPASAIVNKTTGQTYSGNVTVFAKTIDPTTTLGNNTMPGDLRGLSNGNEKTLESYGMMVAEMYDDAGNALQVGNNLKATIKLDIPTSLLSSAKATIPLWHFDEQKEIWVEEGSAILQGNKYVGNVSHFSFWNCDYPFNNVQIQMTLVNGLGVKLVGHQVKITNLSTNIFASGWTNSSGWVGGAIPANTTIKIEILSPFMYSCSSPTVIQSQTMTIGSGNVSLGNITVHYANPSAVISGTTADCNGNLLPNSEVLISPIGMYAMSDGNGTFSVNLSCLPNIPVSFTAHNVASLKSSTASNPITINAGNNAVGQIAMCNSLAPPANASLAFTLTNLNTNASIHYSFETSPQSYAVGGVDTSTPNYTIIAGGDSINGNKTCYFGVKSLTVGTFPLTSDGLLDGFTFPGTNDMSYNYIDNSGTVTITDYQFVGGKIKGSFSANLTGFSTNNNYLIIGNFDVPRLQ